MLCAVAGIGSAEHVLAQSAYIGPSGSTGTPTTGVWSNANNWSPTGVPVSSTTTQLSFGGSGTTSYVSTDDLAGAFTLNQITFANNSSVTDYLNSSTGSSLNFSAGGIISQTGSANFQINAPINISNGVLTISGTVGQGVTLGGVISGTSGIAYTNTLASNYLRFTGTNTFTGGVTVSASAYTYLASPTGLGTGTFTALGTNTLNTTQITATNTVANPISMASSGTLTLLTYGTGTTETFSGNISGGSTSAELYLNTGTSGDISGIYDFSNANSTFTTSTGTTSGIVMNRGSLKVDATNALGNAANSVYLDSYANQSLIFGGSISYTHPTYFGSLATYFNSSTNTVTASGAISGSGVLTKNGAGTLTFSATNTYTGAVNISAGALVGAFPTALPSYTTAGKYQVSSGATLGGRVGGATDFTAANLETLRTTTTFAAGSYFGVDTTDGAYTYTADPGTGGKTALGLNKLGTNSLTLSVVGSYTGGTQVSGGTLIPGVPDALGPGNIIVSSGAAIAIPSTGLDSNATFYANVGSASPANATAGSTGTLNFNQTAGSATKPDLVFGNNHSANSYNGAEVSAAMNLGSTQRYIWGYTSHNGVGQYGTGKTDAVIAGNISGTGGITIIGQNDTYETNMAVGFSLLGSNSFTGPVIIQGGSLYLGNANALVQGNALSLTPVSGDLARFFLYGQNPIVSNLSSSGAGSSIIANGNLATGASQAVAAATLTTNQTTTTTFSGTITDEYLEYSGTGTQTQGNLSLVKNGTAGLILNGSVGYTGSTTINAGRLEIDAVAPTTVVTVNSGGTLAGTGTLNAATVTINNGGTIEAGTGGSGTLTIGSLVLGATSTDTSTINVTRNGIPAMLNVSTGGITVNSGANTVTVNVGGAAPAMGEYPLIEYTGTALSSTAFSAFQLGTVPNRVVGSLVNNTAADTIDLVVSGVDFPVWTGSATNQWNTTDVNWVLNSNNATPTTYQPGDSVLFNDLAGAAHTSVNINGADVLPSSVTFNTSLNYTLNGSNAIAGSTGLTMSGTGSLTINNTNTFTGSVSLSGGTIFASAIGNSGVAGPLGAGGGLLFSGGTLAYTGPTTSTNRAISVGSGGATINVNTSGNTLTLATPITGTGTLNIGGPGTVALPSSTGFSGPIVVNSTNLNVTSDTQLGAVPAAVFPADLTLAGTATLTVPSTLTLSGNRGIAGTGSLIVTGGTLTMTSSNSYSGGTRLNGGALSIANGTELGTGQLNVSTGASAIFLTGANTNAITLPNAINLPAVTAAFTSQIVKNNTGTTATGTALTFNGNISGGSSLLTLEFNSSLQSDYSTSYVLNGTNSFLGGVLINRGSVVVSNPASLGNPANVLTLDSNGNSALGNLQFASSFTLPNPIVLIGTMPIGTNGNNDSLSGVVSGSYSLTKVGAGTLTLLNTNTYTGSTIVNGGTLQVGNGGTIGALPAASAISVASGALIAFSRSDSITVNNAITGAGGLTQVGPGTIILPGTTTYTGPTTINGGKLEIDGLQAGGSPISINATGTLTGVGTVTGPVAVNNGGTLATNGTLTVGGLTFGAVSTDLSTINLVGTTAGSALIYDTGAIVNNSGNNTVTINVSGTPHSNGQYPLIEYNGSASNALSFASFTLGTLPVGVTANLVNDTSNNSIDLNVTGGGDTPKWTGALNSEWINGAQPSPHNWQLVNAGTPTDYVDGNSVTFDDSAQNYTVDISSGNVTPGAVTFTNSGQTYTITGSNGITGSTGVTMTGSASVIFSNLNTYTGDTVIGNGTIAVTTSNVVGAGPLGTGTIRLGTSPGGGNNATLALGTTGSAGGVTLSNPIVVQSGNTGTLTVSGQNASGVNAVTGNITLGTGSAGGTVTLVSATGGELDINGNIVSNGSAAGNVIIGDGNNSGLVKFNGTNTYNGSLTLQNNANLEVGNSTIPAVNNALTINSNATYISTGTLTVNGLNAAGTFTSVPNNGGTIALNNSNASLANPDLIAKLPGTVSDGVVIASNIAISPGNHFIEGASGNNSYGHYGRGDLTLTGQLSGNGSLTISGTPASSQFEVALQADNSNWNGNLNIVQGDVAVVTTNGLNGQNVSLGSATGNTAALYLFSTSINIGNLSSTGTGSMFIRNGGSSNDIVYASNSTLTVNQTANATFAGIVSDGPDDYYAGQYEGPYNQTLGLTKNGTANLTLSASNSYTGDTNVNAGTLSLTTTGALGKTNVYVNNGGTLALNTTAGSGVVVRSFPGSLQINGGGLLTVATAASHNDRQVIVPASFNNNGLIDLGNSDMDLPSNVGYQNISNQIAAGYNGGLWSGTTGITSSAAANNPTHLTTLGVIVNDNGSGSPLYGSGGTIASAFSTITPADGDVLVKYTYYGDANLDGKVDASDYSQIDNSYLSEMTNGGSISGWFNGDFNYDGVINGSDYTLIDNAFNTQGASLAADIAGPDAVTTAEISGPASAVPEPTTLGLLGIGAVGLLGRRRRQTR